MGRETGRRRKGVEREGGYSLDTSAGDVVRREEVERISERYWMSYRRARESRLTIYVEGLLASDAR